MRHQLSPKAPLAAAALAVAMTGVTRADTTSTFANFAAGVALNDAASFNLSGMSGVGQVAVDPNSPDTLIAINRVGTATGGVYAYSLATHNRLTNTAGSIFIGNAAPMTWASTSNDPYSGVVGTDGSFYVAMYTSAGVYKIANPLSDAPTITKILSSYVNGGGDDDIANIARMPSNFGLANYSGNDLILFDDGNNVDGINTIAALHADGSDGNAPVIVWQRSSASTSGTIHGATSSVDGYAYWINTVPEHNTVNGTDYVSLYRVKGDGVLQTIGITLPAGVTLANADDPIAINPADGSIWLADSIFNAGTDTQGRTMLRIDTKHLTATSDPNQFVAAATAAFTATNFNLGVNGLTFNNAGTMLYGGTPNGTDKLWAFDVTPDVAPPHFVGDTNNDGVVDLVDLNNVLNNFGATGSNPGDDNADGTVDLVDLNNVLNNFGATHAASALSVVPEPASLGLLAAGATAVLARRRRAAR